MRMRSGLIFITMAIVGAGLAALLLLAGWVWHIDRTWTPIIEPRIRERQQVGSIRVLAQDAQGQSKWIGSLTAGRLEERQPLKLSEMPTQLVQAIVVLEDPRFLEHGGFDPVGIFRAMAKNVLAMRYKQGGSTITQQLVKNVFLSNQKTLRRKVTELVLSALVENRFSKDEILEAYMNEVYLGQLGSIEIHGVGRAAEYYFAKKIDQLELPEMALLAAMIAGPGYYSPWKHPARTRARRDRVLNALAGAKLILPEELSEALKAPLPGPSSFLAPTRAAYLMDALREKLLADRGELAVLQGGFEVTLSLDLTLQEATEKVLLETTAGWDPQQQALVVAADPRTCEVRAYAGGRSYQSTQLDRIRQSRRAIGSLMKPLEISRLLNDDKTLTLAAIQDDRPLDWSYDGGRHNWKPDNFDHKFRGPVTVRRALEESLNVPMARIFYEREPSGLLNDILDPVRALGLEIPPSRALPSAILGAVDQTPWRTLQAFVKLTRQAMGLAPDAGDFGCRMTLEKTEGTPSAEVDEAHFGQRGARLTLAALEGALRRGTSRALGRKLPVNQAWAGKTGTSSDGRDAWYAALSPELVVLSWTGRDDNQVTKFTGASGALPLAGRLVEEWAKRPAYAAGWGWPAGPDLEWKILSAPTMCRPNETQRMLVRSSHPEPVVGGLPPEAFEFEGQKFTYEMFRAGTDAVECP